jgi:hypothetical protein
MNRRKTVLSITLAVVALASTASADAFLGQREKAQDSAFVPRLPQVAFPE